MPNKGITWLTTSLFIDAPSRRLWAHVLINTSLWSVGFMMIIISRWSTNTAVCEKVNVHNVNEHSHYAHSLFALCFNYFSLTAVFVPHLLMMIMHPTDPRDLLHYIHHNCFDFLMYCCVCTGESVISGLDWTGLD